MDHNITNRDRNTDDLEARLTALGRSIPASEEHLRSILNTLKSTPAPVSRWQWFKDQREFFVLPFSEKATVLVATLALIIVTGGYFGYAQYTSPTGISTQTLAPEEGSNDAASVTNQPAQAAQSTGSATAQTANNQPVPTTPAPATGNIDDIAAAFDQELNQESAMARESDNDADVATYNNSEDYSNLYDENEL